jgi:DNA-binding response OmpR family regulator
VKLTISLPTNDKGQPQLQIKIQDTGIGISQEQIAHIFRRFYQADETAVRSYEGTGIGLALVKELIELMQGTITCSSKVGVGTTFSVILPLLPAPLEESSPLIRPAEVPPLLSNELSSDSTTATTGENPLYKVLVIEDNPELRSFIKKSLAEEYEVMEAVNGRLGFECAIETIPDLIISDIMMPELDGVSLCKKLKETESTSHIPVILLTARADHESKIAGLETGADNYVVKPFKVDELLVRVRNLIETRLKLRERYSRSLKLQPSDVAVNSVDEKFLQRVIAVVEANMSNSSFDVEMFSREVGMSRVQLHRKLTALTDQSASGFTRTFRLKRAACLLEQESGNISEVAFAVGFNSLTYFTKCFKEEYGCAPSEFIASIKQK